MPPPPDNDDDAPSAQWVNTPPELGQNDPHRNDPHRNDPHPNDPHPNDPPERGPQGGHRMPGLTAGGQPRYFTRELRERPYDPRFRCKECGWQGKNERGLDLHHKLRHTEEGKELVATRVRNLTGGRRKTPTFACPICKARYTESGMRYHMGTKHGQPWRRKQPAELPRGASPTPYECPYCDFTTHFKRALAGHMRSHPGKTGIVDLRAGKELLEKEMGKRERSAAKEPQPVVMIRFALRHCPNCGENLALWKKEEQI